MKETDFQKLLRKHLEQNYQCDIDKIHGEIYQKSGLPDLIGVTGSLQLGKGRAVYIECKVLDIPVKPESLVKIDVSTLQIYTLQHKKAKGAIALVACLVIMKDSKKVCLFLSPTDELKDPKYSVTKKTLMEHIIKCINGRAIGVSPNKVVFL